MKQLKLLILLLGLSWSFGAITQTSAFKNYGVEENVSSFIYNTIQDQDGFLYVGTGEGLLKYDGHTFKVINETNGLGGQIVSASFIDSKSRLWLGHSKTGKLTIIEGDELELLDISEYIGNKVNSISEDSNGNIWIASQSEGLVRYSSTGEFTIFKDDFKDYLIRCMSQTSENTLLVGTNEGVFLVDTSTDVPVITFMDEGPYTNVYDFEKVGSSIVVSTEDDGLYLITEKNGKYSIEQYFDEFNFSSFKITDIEKGSEGEVYISAGDRLFRAKLNDGNSFSVATLKDLSSGNSLGTNNIMFSFMDREGLLWVGSYGDGLYKLKDNYFTFFDVPELPEVYGLSINQDTIIASGYGAIVSYSVASNLETSVSFNAEHGIPQDSVLSVKKDTDGTIWIGTLSNGLYYKEKSSDQFISFHLADDINSKEVSCLEVTEQKIYAGTRYGLFIIDKTSKEFEWLNSQTLNHNVINDLYKDKEGKIWLSTLGQDLIYFENDKINFKKISENNGMLIETIGVTKDLEGNVWIATSTQGVVKLQEYNIQFTKKTGLFSSATYGITCDKNGKIWVAHRDGLSKIDPETNKVEVFNYTNGITQDFNNSIVTDREENIWFGSNEGLVLYSPDLDRLNSSEPKVVFTKLLLTDEPMSEDSDWELDYGEYKIEIEFIGVSLDAADQVQYEYYLEGLDDSWGDRTTQRKVTFSKPPPGNYTFKVRAYNQDDFGGETEAQLSISIDNPFWLKPWFIISCIVLLVVTVRTLIYWREKQLKERQEYLEAELDARTEEVVNKNHELQEKNKDITDSINYAKHIQSALIPSSEELKKSLPKSFVFFRPRDIVSGDFYWVRDFGENVVVVGADCTGHGVPGAFISLIGMSVLKEISNRNSVTNPAQALNHLEIEIESTLNKNKSYGVKDGMDLGIMAINKTHRKLQYSGARRPLIIFRGDEHFILNGDRQSIGGSYEGEALKEFSLQDFQLEKGDRLYIWSDGYPDQFGGPRAKKLKQKGLMEILTKMQDKDMDTQHNIVNESFLTWKNGYEQVDDVLMIGIEIE
ncbi:MAG: two-component regulator propeller domain-containing protein [Flavobacteriales bacterium]